MNTAYYIAAQSGNVLGPYEEKEIVDLVTDGLVNVEDRCTPEGEENWKPLGNVVPAVWTSRGAKLRPRRPTGPVVSDRLVLPTFLLWLFFGVLGIHNFYLGRWGLGLTAILVALFAYVLWPVVVLLYIVDGIFVITGSKEDAKGNKVSKWT